MKEIPPLPSSDTLDLCYRPVKPAIGPTYVGVVFGIVLFFVLHNKLGGGSSFVSILASALGALVSVVVIHLIIQLIRNTRLIQLIQEVDDANGLLDALDTRRAISILEDVCRKSQKHPMAHAIAVTSLGVACVREGDPDRALSLFAAAWQSKSFDLPNMQPYRGVIFNNIAIAYLQKGDVARAEEWRDAAYEAFSPARQPLLAGLNLMLSLRTGRGKVGLHDIELNWIKIEGVVIGLGVKTIRVLCAFACQQLIEPEKARQYLDGARPFQPGQFDHLALSWPEFKNFLEQHGLSAQPPVLTEKANGVGAPS